MIKNMGAITGLIMSMGAINPYCVLPSKGSGYGWPVHAKRSPKHMANKRAATKRANRNK